MNVGFWTIEVHVGPVGTCPSSISPVGVRAIRPRPVEPFMYSAGLQRGADDSSAAPEMRSGTIVTLKLAAAHQPICSAHSHSPSRAQMAGEQWRLHGSLRS
jgi:hypothetical protein